MVSVDTSVYDSPSLVFICMLYVSKFARDNRARPMFGHEERECVAFIALLYASCQQWKMLLGCNPD